MSRMMGMPGRFAAAGALWAVGIGVLLMTPEITPARIASHAIWAVLSSLAVLSTWHRSNRTPVARRGWRFLSFGLLLAATYSFLQLATATLGVPVPALVFVLLTILPYPLAVVGMLQWPIARPRRRIRAVLDGVLFAGSFFLIFWETGLGTLVHRTSIGTVEVILNLAWFGGAALVLGMVGYAGGRSLERLRGPLGFIGAGVLVSMGSAVVGAHLTLTGVHYPAHPIELLWLLTPLCMALAALSPHPVVISGDDDERDPTSFAGDLVTYLPAFGALTVSLFFGERGDAMRVVLGLIIGLAFFARQFLALYDGRVLSRSLEQKVTERTRQLEASQAALVLGERMQAIGRVAGGIAHDFRNVLQSIYSQVDLLQDDGLEGVRHERVEAIAKAAQSGSDLVQGLLRIGKPGHGRPVPLDLADLVRRLDWVFREVTERGMAVSLDRLEPAPVRADRVQLEQVVTNLVTNARDAMSAGGRVTVETGVTTDGKVRLAITDTGIGMSKEDVERIFDPFYSTKTAETGTGLGLSTVYAIVTGLGGTINVRSAVGDGSTFEVILERE